MTPMLSNFYRRRWRKNKFERELFTHLTEPCTVQSNQDGSHVDQNKAKKAASTSFVRCESMNVRLFPQKPDHYE